MRAAPPLRWGTLVPFIGQTSWGHETHCGLGWPDQAIRRRPGTGIPSPETCGGCRASLQLMAQMGVTSLTVPPRPYRA